MIPAAIIVYMLKFSRSYPERATHAEPAGARADRQGGTRH